MQRRSLLAGVGTVFLIGGGGCLEETDHQAELRSEIERRGVTVRSMDHEDGVLTVSYDYEDARDDLAEVAMAFVERVDAGWDVEGLEAIARGDPDLSWHAEAAWAREYLDGEIEAGKYGQRISETMAQTVVIGGDDEAETSNDGEDQTATEEEGTSGGDGD